MSEKATAHVYEAMVASSPEKVWKALTDGEQTQQYYFGTRVESDWTVGSSFRYYNPDNSLSSEGVIVEIEPQALLKTTWKPVWLESGGESSTVSWEIQSLGSSTLVKLTHAGIDDATFEQAQMSVGWVYVLSSLKSLLETGSALPVPEIFG
jgi:uncharacterized protein YndB with AHSA1/START domain